MRVELASKIISVHLDIQRDEEMFRFGLHSIDKLLLNDCGRALCTGVLHGCQTFATCDIFRVAVLKVTVCITKVSFLGKHFNF